MELSKALKSQAVVTRYKDLFSMLGSGAYNGTAEFLQSETYDRFIISAADVTASRKEFLLFQGANGRGLSETNFEGAGSIPQGQHYQMNAIAMQISFQGTTPPTEAVVAELLAAIDNAVLTITIANKAPMLIAPVSRVLGMSLLSLMTNTTTTSDSTFRQISNGCYVLNVPIVLPALTSFKVGINFMNAVTTPLVNWSFRFDFQSAQIRGL